MVWVCPGKLPKWPCVVQSIQNDGERPTATVKFFGDVVHETVGLAGMDPFETGFKKLFKKRYEKVGWWQGRRQGGGGSWGSG